MKKSLSKKILAIAVLPVLLVGAVAIFLTMTTMKDSLVSEIEDALKGTAAAALAAYDQNAGDYLVSANGDVWKGNYNISNSETLVDSIKENSGMDVTFFYGSQRIMTSAIDENGSRILGSPAGDKIVEKVLKNGEEYFSDAVSLDGILNYGYYMPVYQKGGAGAPIGMIFVGTDKTIKDAAISRIIWLVVAAVTVVMLCCIVVAVRLAYSTTGALKRAIGIVKKVADGDLNVAVAERELRRNDEIGELSGSIAALQKELKGILEQIFKNAERLLKEAGEIDAMAKQTGITMKNVEKAVAVITENSNEQALSSQGTSKNVGIMGEQITRTAGEVAVLTENATEMSKAGERAAQTMEELDRINKEVKSSIEMITVQTDKTNSSVQEIMQVTQMIASIAEETNLLSLNASIEAARAGESGRGFAVVAAQIQKLAEQSNESSKTIEGIIHALIQESDEAVRTMERVREITDSQSRNMQETQKIVSEVTEGIRNSLQGISHIDNSTRQLEETRNEVIRAVEDLSETARSNAESTVETCTATREVTGAFGQIGGSMDNLRNIADELLDSMKYFKVN